MTGTNPPRNQPRNGSNLKPLKFRISAKIGQFFIKTLFPPLPRGAGLGRHQRLFPVNILSKFRPIIPPTRHTKKGRSLGGALVERPEKIKRLLNLPVLLHLGQGLEADIHAQNALDFVGVIKDRHADGDAAPAPVNREV